MTRITRSDELRLHNRSRVLACLREKDNQSRTSIGRSTGMSAATVTQVTSDLINDGIIEQVTPDTRTTTSSPQQGRRGRPQVLLRLKGSAATAAVITLLLNHIEITLYSYAGLELQRINTPLITSSLTPASLQQQLLDNMDKALASDVHFRNSLKHIALVCQGTVNSDNTGMLWSPITQVRDFDFGGILQRHYGVPVTASNDCNIIANALYVERQSHARIDTPDSNLHNIDQSSSDSEENFAAILLSYGLGMGFFHKGSMLVGTDSSGAEFGHMLYQADGALCRCGRRGCIEAYAADYAIWRRATGQPTDSAPEDNIAPEAFAKLITIATQQEGPERDAFAEAGAAIGQGLTNLFAIFDPFPTVLVGGASIGYELMEAALVKNLRHYGIGDSSRYLSVHGADNESRLIRKGASLQALSHIDRDIFGFGEKVLTLKSNS